MPDPTHSPEPTGTRGSPLWAVLTIAFLASLGTGVVTLGIYFLTGFDKVGNYALGTTMGAVYVVSALTASRTLVRLGRLARWLTPRTVLGIILGAIGAICFLPMLAPGGTHDWAAWIVAAAYMYLTGMLWPLIEAFVSGGRSGRALRSATGRFNVWWAAALPISLVAMGPLVREAPETILGLLGIAHLACLPLLPALGARPGRSGEIDHEPHPAVYTRLLRVFRVQLPTSYMVIGALSPFLPIALETLGITGGWRTPMAAIWMATQVGAFAALERWHGWHGRWWVSVAGGVWLLGGFAACLLAPAWGASGTSIGLFVAGLVSFGLGTGTIYTAALYYAMEVGHEEVASGGTHEALIGSGYLTGPLAGLAVALLVDAGALSEGRFEATKLGVVAAACAVLGVAGWAMAWRGSRGGSGA